MTEYDVGCMNMYTGDSDVETLPPVPAAQRAFDSENPGLSELQELWTTNRSALVSVTNSYPGVLESDTMEYNRDNARTKAQQNPRSPQARHQGYRYPQQSLS